MHAIAVLALMVASVSADNPEPGSVHGTVKLTEDGHPLRCVGVYLIPATPTNDELVALRFGDTEQASTATLLPEARTGTRLPPAQGTQTSSCRGRFTKAFSFSDIAPGEYYLTTTATPSRSHREDQLRRSSVEMMRRITVAPDSSVEVHFR